MQVHVHMLSVDAEKACRKTVCMCENGIIHLCIRTCKWLSACKQNVNLFKQRMCIHSLMPKTEC